MHPILYDFGFYKLHTYGVLLALGFLAALILGRIEAKRMGIKPAIISDVLIWVLGFGILGARIVYVIIHPEDLSSFFAIWKGGLVYYGGFIGGTVGGILFALRRKVSVLDLADLAMPCAMLGQFIGRWGCFMAGCCYGKATKDSPPGVAFPASPDSLIPPTSQNLDLEQFERLKELKGLPEFEKFDGLSLSEQLYEVNKLDPSMAERWEELQFLNKCADPDHAVYLHPTQVYMSLNALILFILLWILLRRRKYRGVVVSAFCLLYAVSRFLIELVRGDAMERGYQGPLSSSQWISVFIVLFGIYLFWTRRRRPVPDTSAPEEEK